MGFYKEKLANPTVDCSNDEILVEQSHAAEVDINNIIRKHGMDIIQQTSALQAPTFQFDDVTGNDFQEAMFKVTKAQESFNALPSAIRTRFNNSAAEFLDFIQNSDNIPEMVKLGLANPPANTPSPIKVEVINPVTPPA